MPSAATLLAKARTLRRAAGFCAWSLAGRPAREIRGVWHIVEEGDWVIRRIGDHLRRGLEGTGIPFRVDTTPRFCFDSVVHFGSVHAFAEGGYAKVHPSNALMVTMYHGDRGLSPQFDAGIDRLLDCRDRLGAVVVSTALMRRRAASWGLPEDKVHLIPIGVDLPRFHVAEEAERARLRMRMGIPADAACLGSFQKDGNGWGEGLEPKLIKGPDVFVHAAARLARERKIHCLLTGPSRGYVKKGLQEAGVPFTHVMPKDYAEVAELFGCLDLYLVTSREEGGPMALMESMAAGVPLVSTRVGMAPDMIEDGKNGFLAEIGDVDGIVRLARAVLDGPALRDGFRAGGLRTVERYDWSVIAREYADLYRRVIAHAGTHDGR